MSRTARRAVTWLAAVVILLPIVEIYLLVLLGRQVGALPVLGLVVAEALIGAWLIRRRWRAAWQSMRAGTGAAGTGALGDPGPGGGEAPLAEAVDTLLVVTGGIALIFPGLITDLVGLICLLPFTRRLPRRLLRGWLDRRVAGLSPAFGGLTWPGPRRGDAVGTDVVEGEVVDDPSDADSASRSGRGEHPGAARGEIRDR